MFYCDVDEFLFGITDIKEFLGRFRNMPIGQVRVKWKLIGDDGFIERDMSKPVYEVFKHSPKITYERNLTYSGTLKEQGKAFVRGGLQNVVVTSHISLVSVSASLSFQVACQVVDHAIVELSLKKTTLMKLFISIIT